MKTQVVIATKSDLSTSALGMILTGRRRPSWRAAKRLESVTGIPAPFWMEASPDELRRKLGLPAKRPYRKKETASEHCPEPSANRRRKS